MKLLVGLCLAFHIARGSELNCSSTPLSGGNGLYLTNEGFTPGSSGVVCGGIPDSEFCAGYLSLDESVPWNGDYSTINITGSYSLLGSVHCSYHGCHVNMAGILRIECCATLTTWDLINVDNTSELAIGINSTVSVDEIRLEEYSKLIVGNDSRIEKYPYQDFPSILVSDHSTFLLGDQTTFVMDGVIKVLSESHLSVSGFGLISDDGFAFSVINSRVILTPIQQLTFTDLGNCEATIEDSAIELTDSFFDLLCNMQFTRSSVRWNSNSIIFLPHQNILFSATFEATNATFYMKQGKFEMQSRSELLLDNVYVGSKTPLAKFSFYIGDDAVISLKGTAAGEKMYCYTINDMVDIVIPDGSNFTQDDKIPNLSCSTAKLSDLYWLNNEDNFVVSTNRFVANRLSGPVNHLDKCDYVPNTTTTTQTTTNMETANTAAKSTSDKAESPTVTATDPSETLPYTSMTHPTPNTQTASPTNESPFSTTVSHEQVTTSITTTTTTTATTFPTETSNFIDSGAIVAIVIVVILVLGVTCYVYAVN